MIEEVKEFFGDMKDGLGNKGFLLFIGGALLFGLYHLLKADDSDGEVYYTPSGVVGYPSLDKNADVVIDSVNNTIEGALSEVLGSLQYSESTIIGGLTDMESNLAGNISDATDAVLSGVSDAKDEINENVTGAKDEVNENMTSGFDAVNNYIQEGLDKMNDISNKIDNIDTTPIVSYIPVGGDTINNTVNVTDSIVGTIVNGSTVENVTGNVNITTNNTTNNNTTNYAPSTASEPKTPTVTQTKTETKTTTTASKSPETYSYTKKGGLNTNTSIVDALKATGVDSSLANRKKIAEANGISNYTGSYSQNVAMLNKLKAGELVKPSGGSGKTVTEQYAREQAMKYINNGLNDGV